MKNVCGGERDGEEQGELTMGTWEGNTKCTRTIKNDNHT